MAVAVTRPFEFEGLRKLEQADALIEALQVRWQPVQAPAPLLAPASALAGQASSQPAGWPSAPPLLTAARCRLPFSAACLPQDIAQLVVVVNQGILQQASKELTIAQASTIADNTLEYTIRAILWALRAPEILVGAQGGRPLEAEALGRAPGRLCARAGLVGAACCCCCGVTLALRAPCALQARSCGTGATCGSTGAC